jgi:cysteine synthase
MSLSSLPRSLVLLSLGIVLGSSATYLLTHRARRRRNTATDDELENLKEDIVDGVEGLIGTTKLVRIRSLSLATGCEILAKAEVATCTNPY